MRLPLVMKRFDLLPALLLVPVLGFVTYQAMNAPGRTATTQAAVLAPTAKAPPRGVPDSADPPRGVERTRMAPPTEADRDVAEIRRHLHEGEPGTYMGEIVRQRDSALARWPERIDKPIRVWIGSGDGLPNWDPTFSTRVKEAFGEWSGLGIPINFRFDVDSMDADVHVVWIDQFAEPISGKTLWARDRHWWIVDGNITLALHHNGGEALDPRAVRAIALHEVGHLLGLDHTADTSNIMTPRVRVRDLSDQDRATIRLLYSVQPGSLK